MLSWNDATRASGEGPSRHRQRAGLAVHGHRKLNIRLILPESLSQVRFLVTGGTMWVLGSEWKGRLPPPHHANSPPDTAHQSWKVSCASASGFSGTRLPARPSQEQAGITERAGPDQQGPRGRRVRHPHPDRRRNRYCRSPRPAIPATWLEAGRRLEDSDHRLPDATTGGTSTRWIPRASQQREPSGCITGEDGRSALCWCERFCGRVDLTRSRSRAARRRCGDAQVGTFG
jgi:hypothetical protein